MSGRLMMVDSGGLQKPIGAGDCPIVPDVPLLIAADAAATLDVAKIVRGAILFTGLTAGRNLTVDTAANLVAAFPGMNIGEAICVRVGVSTAFALTLVTAAGITLKGRATVPASTTMHIYFVRTGAATFDAVCV